MYERQANIVTKFVSTGGESDDDISDYSVGTFSHTLD